MHAAEGGPSWVGIQGRVAGLAVKTQQKRGKKTSFPGRTFLVRKRGGKSDKRNRGHGGQESRKDHWLSKLNRKGEVTPQRGGKKATHRFVGELRLRE